jgi:hypothetical protein
MVLKIPTNQMPGAANTVLTQSSANHAKILSPGNGAILCYNFRGNMSYQSFKREVFRRANRSCECKGCDSVAETVHHLLKQSTYPEFKEDPDCGLATCGSCHTEIERREREGESLLGLIPKTRVRIICKKLGRYPEKYKEFEA